MSNDDFKAFVVSRLRAAEPALDLTAGSRWMTRVVEPIVSRFGDDPLGLDTGVFIRTRLQQEFPNLGVVEGHAIDDALVKPSIPIVSAFRRALMQIQTDRSLINLDTMSDNSVDAWLANFFLSRAAGGYAVGTGRVFFSSPTYATFTATNPFISRSGLTFLPPNPQTITVTQMAAQRQGGLYYADVILRAESPGEDYNLEPGDLTSVTGIDGAVRVTNLFRFSGGLARETNVQASSRGEQALTERSLTSGRGIFTRIMDLYAGAVRNLVVVGMGDPEMQRDILRGSSEGRLLSSGVSLTIGTFVLHMGMFEDRGILGTELIEVGNTIDLNYWPLLYGLSFDQQHEEFAIEAIVADTRTLIPSIPSIVLMQLDGIPAPTGTVLGGIPAVLPGVFSAVKGNGQITVSELPGGILQPTTPNGLIEVDDNAVHLGGKHDIWVRPTADTAKALTVTALADEEPLVAGRTIVTAGLGANPNIVSSSDATVDWIELGTERGMLLVIQDGVDAGTYAILEVAADHLVLDADMTSSEASLLFKVVDEVQHDLVTPKVLKVPFGTEAPGNDLATIIGSETVVLGINAISYGAEVGDTLEILAGPNEGIYQIISFATSGGGTTPTLDRPMGSSGSHLSYKIYTAQEAIQRPMVRIQPQGVRLLDSADQTTDTVIPPALPVDARNTHAFTGAEPICDGRWGFVAPDPGPIFQPVDSAPCSATEWLEAQLMADVVDPDEEDRALEILDVLDAIISGGDYTDGCIPCDGWIACVRLTTKRLHISFLPNSGFVTYLGQIVDWLDTVFTNFFRMANPFTIEADATGISIPLGMGAELPGEGETPLWQTEICIPKEFFDCCCNVWIGLPEFDIARLAQIIDAAVGGEGWDAMENLDNLFTPEVILAVLSLIADAHDPCALQAQAGDVLVLHTGPNAGGYVIQDVHRYDLKIPLAFMGTTTDEALAWAETVPILSLAVVIIEGEFQVQACEALCDFFAEGFPDEPPFPDMPEFDGYCYDDYGNEKSPFDWLIKFMQWFMDFLSSLGLDVPDDIPIQPGTFVQGLFGLLFPSYGVGEGVCEGTVRVYWAEPTTAEFDGSGNCLVLPDDDDDSATPPPVIRSGPASLFTGTIGETELLFAASTNVDPYMLFPSKDTTVDVNVLDWPRHLSVVQDPGGWANLQITDLEVPAPIALGLQPFQDVLQLHEERFLLGTKDRRPALATIVGSNIVRILDSFPHDVIADQEIEDGDILFIEEGLDADGYRVTRRLTDKTFELDRPMVDSTLSVIKDGADGSFDATAVAPANARFTSASSPFTTEDIGRYLTVYGTVDGENDVSRRIAAVAPDGSSVDLDDPFSSVVDVNVVWCVSAAPATPPGVTDAGGTELVALRPFRVYNGTATEWMVMSVDTSLDNSVAAFEIMSYGEFLSGDAVTAAQPTDGVHQPFSVVRPGIQRITSTQMAENRENGLYYFDVKVRSLGYDEVFNIARTTKLEPVLGTYRADGYRYDVENTNLTFSSYEEVGLVFSPRFLPVGLEDREENFLPCRGQRLQITYDQAPLVDQIQQVLKTNLDRQLVSDPLARHFLPSYVYLHIVYKGGDETSVIAQDFTDKIRGLEPEDEFSVAALEKMMEQRGVADWTHPIEIITLTHDLDRRMVVERSEDRVGGTALVLYNGTNRTSYLIPGPDRSTSDEEDIPPGERIFLERESAVTVLK